MITDKNGNVVSRRDFMPFGEEIGAGVGTRTTNLKYTVSGYDNIRKRYTGYEKDPETGLDFAEARMYQNKHGRFTAVDPLMASANPGDPQTFNRYTYTGNNPLNFNDPNGLCGTTATAPTNANPKPCVWLQNRDGGYFSVSKDEYGDGSAFKDATLVSDPLSVTFVNPVFTGTYSNVDKYNEIAAAGLSVGLGADGMFYGFSTDVTMSEDEDVEDTFGPSLTDCVPAYQCTGARHIKRMTPEGAEGAADTLQIALAGCGAIVDVCDLFDGAISGIRGDYTGLAMTLPSAIPVIGASFAGPKIARKIHKAENLIETASDARKLRNGHLANGIHPKSGVPFDSNEFPDFSGHLFKGGKNDVNIAPTGSRSRDVAAANKAAGYLSTPKNHVWHHHQTTGRMQLVDEAIHRATGHTGGF